MSFLEALDGIPDHSKGVIAFWFRMPGTSRQKVVDTSKAELAKHPPTEQFPVYARMMNILPLLTFGKLYDGYQIDHNFDETMTYYTSFVSWSFGGYFYIYSNVPQEIDTGPIFTKTSTFKANPSFIGIQVTEDEDAEDGFRCRLKVRLQTKEFGAGTWVNSQFKTTYSDYTIAYYSNPFGTDTTTPPFAHAWDFNPEAYCLNSPYFPGGEWTVTTTYKDVTELFTRQYGPESFEAEVDLQIVPDHWHVVIVSYDLEHSTKGVGVRSVHDILDCELGGTREPFEVTPPTERKITDPCKMWIAIDDVHYDKVFVPELTINGIGDNDIASGNVFDAYNSENNIILHDKFWGIGGLIQIDIQSAAPGVPTYTHKKSMIPSDKFPIGIPSIAALLESICHVEMAEMQIFIDVTLDTKLEANRRLFVTNKGRPELNYTALEKKLGKPVRRLHRSGNWKNGNDTGTLGDPENLHDWIAKAKIEIYRPNPTLRGPQGDKQ